MNNNEFDKFARMHQGISSTTLSRYQSALDAYINPSIIEERKLNVAPSIRGAIMAIASNDPLYITRNFWIVSMMQWGVGRCK